MTGKKTTKKFKSTAMQNMSNPRSTNRKERLEKILVNSFGGLGKKKWEKRSRSKTKARCRMYTIF